MNNKINIAKLLKYCPPGMELDCVMYEDCKFLDVDATNEGYLIRMTTPCGIKYLDKYGRYTADDKAKCVIFPKGKTTWDGFVPPCKFKDGDILYIDCNDNEDIYKDNQYIFILKEISDSKIYCYCYIDEANKYKRFDECWLSDMIYTLRFATEEEKKKLFQAIKDNGYKWNEKTKTLEKLIVPKFKVGDKVVRKDGIGVSVLITEVGNADYFSENENSTHAFIFGIKDQDDYVLVPNKFDITTLKPFESKVLVRDKNTNEWRGHFFSHYDNNSDTPYNCIGVEGLNDFKQCIPFEGNEHLLGKADDCDEYYKTWK